MRDIVFSLNIFSSKYILAYLIVVHFIMCSVLLSLVNFSLWSIVILGLFVVGFTYYYQQYQCLSPHNCLMKIERDDNDLWRISTKDQQYLSLKLMDSIVTSKLLILSFSINNRLWPYQVLVMNDAVDKQQFRQLRVYCRAFKSEEK